MRYLRRSPWILGIIFVLAGSILLITIFAPWNTHPGPRFHVSIYPRTAIIPKTSATVAFSTRDVQDYVLSHPFPARLATAGHTIKVLSITLMPRQQPARQDVKAQAAMQYLVIVEGPFWADFPGVVSISTITDQGYEIFDAHTGDLIEWGLY